MEAQTLIKKILFVDDEPYRSVHFLGLLKACFNIKIVIASTVIEAKTIVNDSDFDLIILDMLIPYSDDSFIDSEQFNGLKFLRYLKENQVIKDIPVICVSAANQDWLISEINSLDSTIFIKGAGNYEDLLFNISKLLKVDII